MCSGLMLDKKPGGTSSPSLMPWAATLWMGISAAAPDPLQKSQNPLISPHVATALIIPHRAFDAAE